MWEDQTYQNSFNKFSSFFSCDQLPELTKKINCNHVDQEPDYSILKVSDLTTVRVLSKLAWLEYELLDIFKERVKMGGKTSHAGCLVTDNPLELNIKDIPKGDFLRKIKPKEHLRFLEFSLGILSTSDKGVSQCTFLGSSQIIVDLDGKPVTQLCVTSPDGDLNSPITLLISYSLFTFLKGLELENFKNILAVCKTC